MFDHDYEKQPPLAIVCQPIFNPWSEGQLVDEYCVTVLLDGGAFHRYYLAPKQMHGLLVPFAERHNIDTVGICVGRVCWRNNAPCQTASAA